MYSKGVTCYTCVQKPVQAMMFPLCPGPQPSPWICWYSGQVFTSSLTTCVLYSLMTTHYQDCGSRIISRLSDGVSLTGGDIVMDKKKKACRAKGSAHNREKFMMSNSEERGRALVHLLRSGDAVTEGGGQAQFYWAFFCTGCIFTVYFTHERPSLSTLMPLHWSVVILSSSSGASVP